MEDAAYWLAAIAIIPHLPGSGGVWTPPTAGWALLTGQSDVSIFWMKVASSQMTPGYVKLTDEPAQLCIKNWLHEVAQSGKAPLRKIDSVGPKER